MGKTPTGLMILAVLCVIGGLFSFIEIVGDWFVLLFFSYSYTSTMGYVSGYAGIILLAFVISIVVSILLLLTGYGLFKRKAWAWKIGVITFSLVILTNIGIFLASPPLLQQDIEFLATTVVSIMYGAVILVYLNTSKVKSYFQTQQEQATMGVSQPSIPGEEATDRTVFSIPTRQSDLQQVQQVIQSWVTRNKGKILTPNATGQKISVTFGIAAHPKPRTVVIKFSKATAPIMFELRLEQEMNQVIIKGEGYVPQMGNFELDLDPNAKFGFVPRKKGHALLMELQSQFQVNTGSYTPSGT